MGVCAWTPTLRLFFVASKERLFNFSRGIIPLYMISPIPPIFNMLSPKPLAEANAAKFLIIPKSSSSDFTSSKSMKNRE